MPRSLPVPAKFIRMVTRWCIRQFIVGQALACRGSSEQPRQANACPTRRHLWMEVLTQRKGTCQTLDLELIPTASIDTCRNLLNDHD